MGLGLGLGLRLRLRLRLGLVAWSGGGDEARVRGGVVQVGAMTGGVRAASSLLRLGQLACVPPQHLVSTAIASTVTANIATVSIATVSIAAAPGG